MSDKIREAFEETNLRAGVTWDDTKGQYVLLHGHRITGEPDRTNANFYLFKAGATSRDDDFESSDRAYDNWRSGGDFEDPCPGNRFS
jgi:8-oxo-dGTP pyrophosphatase MutT (NUDIX family)